MAPWRFIKQPAMPAPHPSTIPIRANHPLFSSRAAANEIAHSTAIINRRSLCIVASLDQLRGTVEQQKQCLDHGCRIWWATRYIDVYRQDAFNAVAATVSAASGAA